MHSPVLLKASLIVRCALWFPKPKAHDSKTSFRKTQFEQQLSNSIRTFRCQPLVVLGSEPVIRVTFDDDDQIGKS